jgi:mono/diheme cytochrome c family protein
MPLPGGGQLGGAQELDADRVRARLDRDGDGGFDQPLRIGPFTFSHAQNIVPFIQAAKVEALHARLSFGTGTEVVIPAGHPVGPFLDVLLSDEASAVHGLSVVVDAADAAGLPEVGDVLARAGRDQAVEAAETVTLDGSGSIGFVDGAVLSYEWSQAAGDPVELSGAESAEAAFVAAPVAEETVLSFRLTVSDGTSSDTDDVSITIAAGGDVDGGDTGGGDPVAGQAAYLENGCSACHADDASGGAGPALPGDRTDALLERFGGGADHLGTTLTDEEIADVAAWLATLEP